MKVVCRTDEYEPDVKEMTLPRDAIQLEEANLARDMAAPLAGKTVTVEVLPEEAPGTRRAEPEENPVLIDRQGNRWNDYRPARVLYTDAQVNVWRLPRHWLAGTAHSSAPQPDSNYPVTREHVFPEALHLPSFWGLLEIKSESWARSRLDDISSNMPV